MSVRRALPPLPRPAQFLEMMEMDGPAVALDVFRELKSGHPAFTPCREQEIRLKGLRLLGAGKAAESLAAFTLATETFPDSHRNYTHLAEAYVAVGDFPKAEAACQKAKARLAMDLTVENTARAQAEAVLDRLSSSIAARRIPELRATISTGSRMRVSMQVCFRSWPDSFRPCRDLFPGAPAAHPG